jgi:ABC-2 type transport system ATP-binding protein
MLEFDRASKRFRDLAALDSCSFAAQPGRLTGFLGPNGAGKTTAMRSIFGLVALDDGAVLWQGAPIGMRERSRFGYMPEERGLYPRMRVRDQLIYLGELCGRSRGEAGRGVDGWLDRLNLGSRADERVDALSHGNQQRVQLIAALVNDPELLVLDEPFSGLDPLAVADLRELLADVAAAGAAVLFSSHQLDLVEDVCDDVVVIDHGHVVLTGRLQEMRDAALERWVDVRFRGSAPEWATLDGVEVVRAGDGWARLRIGDSDDLQAIVSAAGRPGQLLSLTYQPPSLSELFRQAVAS